MRSLEFKVLLAILTVIVNGVFSANAAVLFKDDFSSSSGVWEAVNTGANAQMSLEDNTVKIVNNSSTIAIFKVKNKSFSDFTFSAKIISEEKSFENVGILFCLNSNIGGYSYTISSNQTISSAKLPDGGGAFVPLLFWPTSYITRKDNVLKVCKKGNQIRFFCNDVFVNQIVDSTHSAGTIGIIIGAKTTIKYDDVLVTDEDSKTKRPVCYSNDFEISSDKDWFLANINGTAAFEAGRLTLTVPKQGINSVIWTDGDFGADTLRSKVIVNCKKYDTQDSTAYYGLAFFDIKRVSAQEYNYDYLYFVITPYHTHAIISSLEQTFVIFPPELPRRFINGMDGPDTLEVILEKQGAKSFKAVFKANAKTLHDTLLTYNSEYRFDAVGLVADNNLSIEFDDFAVGYGSDGKCSNTQLSFPIHRKKDTQYLIWNEGIGLIDPIGRILNPFVDRKSKGASPGFYIVPPLNSKGKTLILR